MVEEQEKTRIRSEEELIVQGKNLALVRNVLEENKLPPIICGGTLLGAIREQDFIKWDWDAEFFLRYDDVKDIINDIVDGLQRFGFTIHHYNEWDIVATKDGFDFELFIWKRKNQHYVHHIANTPIELIESTRTITLRGEEYKAPLHAEDFLTYRYGDWQTPKMSGKAEEYLTAAYYPKTKRFVFRMKNIFFGTIYKAVKWMRSIRK